MWFKVELLTFEFSSILSGGKVSKIMRLQGESE